MGFPPFFGARLTIVHQEQHNQLVASQILLTDAETWLGVTLPHNKSNGERVPGFLFDTDCHLEKGKNHLTRRHSQLGIRKKRRHWKVKLTPFHFVVMAARRCGSKQLLVKRANNRIGERLAVFTQRAILSRLAQYAHRKYGHSFERAWHIQRDEPFSHVCQFRTPRSGLNTQVVHPSLGRAFMCRVSRGPQNLMCHFRENISLTT